MTHAAPLDPRHRRRMPPWRAAAVLAAALLCSAAAPAQTPTRGELLYGTHCITCHTAQMHWRDRRAATDWATLRLQVRRWQGAASLGWSDDDIDEVARYLNDTVYRYPLPDTPQTSAPPPGRP